MSAELARLDAAQKKADAIASQVADHDGSDAPRLLVAVIDPVTNTRLVTAFAGYEIDRPSLRLVKDAS
ncbi:hypothetical protein [Streptomyces sp. NPDC093598]|uniref:hypothetical protein n=1 Tax=Streptomyces sp. NPDC093598 TaxID=3366046 RepID=UPI00380D41E7